MGLRSPATHDTEVKERIQYDLANWKIIQQRVRWIKLELEEFDTSSTWSQEQIRQHLETLEDVIVHSELPSSIVLSFMNQLSALSEAVKREPMGMEVQRALKALLSTVKQVSHELRVNRRVMEESN